MWVRVPGGLLRFKRARSDEKFPVHLQSSLPAGGVLLVSTEQYNKDERWCSPCHRPVPLIFEGQKERGWRASPGPLTMCSVGMTMGLVMGDPGAACNTVCCIKRL